MHHLPLRPVELVSVAQAKQDVVKLTSQFKGGSPRAVARNSGIPDSVWLKAALMQKRGKLVCDVRCDFGGHG